MHHIFIISYRLSGRLGQMGNGQAVESSVVAAKHRVRWEPLVWQRIQGQEQNEAALGLSQNHPEFAMEVFQGESPPGFGGNCDSVFFGHNVSADS
ncbi:hypothetical protein QTO34_003733 [Cnephaeus nilssonii]|uniref:Uncharacterized protein n=1 Tax=Cnephaeus nilssonii TaxID=3371016 RepID=A0AA40HR77_CNENI|nr:hypothetical protein QTO34_003733 [Eptesicus nilssonii]